STGHLRNPSEFGCQGVQRAKRLTRRQLRCSSSWVIDAPIFPSSFLAQTSAREALRKPAQGSTHKVLRPMSRRNGCDAFLSKWRVVIELTQRSAILAFSLDKTSFKIHLFLGSMSSVAVTC